MAALRSFKLKDFNLVGDPSLFDEEKELVALAEVSLLEPVELEVLLPSSVFSMQTFPLFHQ